MLNKTDPAADRREAVVVKKYANRRLYNTETSTYVTLEDLAAMVRSDRDFVVYDAKSGDDLTHAVLTQIIVEQEGRKDGHTLLPIPFLRQLIRFYDDSIGRMVPSYLQFSLENLVKEQEKFRSQFTNAFSNPAAAFEAYQNGIGTITDAITAENGLLDAREARADAHAASLVAASTLAFSLGAMTSRASPAQVLAP
jgi:polyhydroxyalkanoate synthesis repressor PhaR